MTSGGVRVINAPASRTQAAVRAEAAIGARHPQVAEMVDDTVATRGVEIERMREVLADL